MNWTNPGRTDPNSLINNSQLNPENNGKQDLDNLNFKSDNEAQNSSMEMNKKYINLLKIAIFYRIKDNFLKDLTCLMILIRKSRKTQMRHSIYAWFIIQHHVAPTKRLFVWTKF